MRLIFFVMCKFVIHFSCVINITLQLLNVLVEVELKIISLSWSAASISLVHRNPLWEHCSLVDQGVLEGNAPSANQVVYHTWCRVLGSTSPHTYKLIPCLALLWINTWPIRCRNFCASTFWRLHWGVELQSSLVSSLWSWSTASGGYSHAAQKVYQTKLSS